VAIDLRTIRVELRNIRANPEDTEAGVRLTRAFGGEASEQRYWEKVRQTSEVGELLRDRTHFMIFSMSLPAMAEIALMAFTGAQDGQKQATWLARLGCVMFILVGRFDLLKMIRNARKRGNQSPWMFAPDW
jgi:hypothetical protein